MNAIIDFFSDIVTWVVLLFTKIWEWLVSLLRDLIDPFLSPLSSLIPDLNFDSLDVIAPYVSFVNRWIALDYGFVLLTAYFTFIVVMISIKLIIKLFIPTVG